MDKEENNKKRNLNKETKVFFRLVIVMIVLFIITPVTSRIQGDIQDAIGKVLNNIIAYNNVIAVSEGGNITIPDIIFDAPYYQESGINLLNLVFLIIFVVYTIKNFKKIELKFLTIPILIIAILFFPLYFEIEMGGISGSIYMNLGIIPSIIYVINSLIF